MANLEKKVKNGYWSPEEDQKLVKYINTHGEEGWKSVAENAGLQRDKKSCRLRWVNYLKPGIKRGPFSSEEQRTIIDLHRIYGRRWSLIAKHLPGRTDNDLKNQWNAWLKKKLIEQGLDANTHNLPSSNSLDINACNRHFSPLERFATGTIGRSFNLSKPSLATQGAMSSGSHGNLDSVNAFLDFNLSNTSTLLSTSASCCNSLGYAAMEEDRPLNWNNIKAANQDHQKQVVGTIFDKVDDCKGRLTSEEAAKEQKNCEDVHGSFDLCFMEPTFVASIEQFLREAPENTGHHEKAAKKRRWSAEEDEKLVECISTHGERCWNSVAKPGGLRKCGRSCRWRWLDRRSFSSEEERTITDFHRTLGRSCSQNSKYLPGRTENDVKNHWKLCLQKKFPAQVQDPNTHNRPSSNSSEINSCSPPFSHQQLNGTFTIGTAFNSSKPSLFTQGAMPSGCHGYVDLMNYFINSIPTNTSTLLSTNASSSFKSLEYEAVEQDESWNGNNSVPASQDHQKQVAGSIFDKETNNINGILSYEEASEEQELF